MKKISATVSALLTTAFIVSLTAQAQDRGEDIIYLLQSRAGMEETRSPTTIPYRFTLHINLSELDSDGPRNVQAEVRIDPSKPAGSRTRIVTTTPRHRQILIDFLDYIENPKTSMEAIVSDFWCKSIHDNEDVDLSTFTVVSQTDTEAVLKPNADKLTELLLQKENKHMDKSQRKMKKKLMDRIDGKVFVSKRDGSTKSFHADMTQSVTRKTIVKIKTMSLDQSCAVAPNGHRYKSRMKRIVKGTALGEKFSSDHDIRITDLTPLP